jgi:hypothetical protein
MAVLTMYLDNSILGGYPAVRMISPLEIVDQSQDEDV